MPRKSSLTAQQRAEILRLGSTGLSLREIAKRVGTSKDTARRVLLEVPHPQEVPQETASRPAEPPPAPKPARPTPAAPAPAQPPPMTNGMIRPMTEEDHAAMDRDRIQRASWLW